MQHLLFDGPGPDGLPSEEDVIKTTVDLMQWGDWASRGLPAQNIPD